MSVLDACLQSFEITKSMDTVFIDTSVVVAHKYFHAKSLVTILGQLAAKGHIHIVMPEITVQEIRANFKKDFNEAISALVKHQALYSHYDDSLSGVDLKEALPKGMKKIEEFFKLPNVEILPYDKNCDITAIFKNYFAGKPPFNTKNKKSEFPDAFVLNALEKYANENRVNITCLSLDGDFTTYQGKRLIQGDLREFVSQKQKELEDLEAFETALATYKEHLLEKAKEKVYEYLDDERLYNHCGEIEIKGVEVQDVNLAMDTDDYTIFYESADDMQVSVPVELTCTIRLTFDNYEMSYYDKEDHEWYGIEEDEMTMTKNAMLYLNLQFEKTSLFPDQGEITIEDIDFTELDEALGI